MIRIVTDSTADVPEEVAARLGIVVIPAYINVGDQSYVDGVDLTRGEFYRRLPHFEHHPTTAAPAAGVFSETYQKLAEEGATEIISVHIASELSAMLNSARLGAETTEGVPVHLVDSGQISLGIGWLAMIAAEAASTGQDLEDVLALVEDARQRICLFAALDTLEYLRRSGRVNWAQFGLGTLLQIKPVLRVGQGRVDVHERVRTRKRAVSRLEELVAAHAPFERLAVLHTDAPDEAEALRGQLARYAPENGALPIVEVTPTIGVHTGPGALGFSGVMKRSQAEAAVA